MKRYRARTVPTFERCASLDACRSNATLRAMLPHGISHASCMLQIGFLYLRYVGDPKDLLSWCEPYFGDEEVRTWQCTCMYTVYMYVHSVHRSQQVSCSARVLVSAE